MLSEGFSELQASLNGLPEEHRKALAEYYHLAMMPELSETQAARMQHILELAETSDIISFLLNEIDELTFQELGFYGEEDPNIDNEIAKIKEFVLAESELRVLTPSLSQHSRRARPPAASGLYPRVEMVIDAEHRILFWLDRVYSQEATFICPYCHKTRIGGGTDCGDVCPKVQPASRSLLQEDPLSVAAILAIGVFILLVVL